MSRRWTRPESVPFPSVWCRFQGRKEINGIIPKFWIQDIPEDQYESVIKIMADGFLDDEPVCKYSNVKGDKESVAGFYELWREILKDKLGLICYMENPNANGAPIVASINCTHLFCKGDTLSTKSKGKPFIKVLDTVEYVAHMKNCYEELGIDNFLNALGLYVLPEFRGQGLGLEMLKAREPLCTAVGIKASITAFTATVSQMLAAKAGFKDLSEISYADLERINPTLRYPGIETHTKSLKYMYILYERDERSDEK